jgi:hypothetical protein
MFAVESDRQKIGDANAIPLLSFQSFSLFRIQSLLFLVVALENPVPVSLGLLLDFVVVLCLEVCV